MRGCGCRGPTSVIGRAPGAASGGPALPRAGGFPAGGGAALGPDRCPETAPPEDASRIRPHPTSDGEPRPRFTLLQATGTEIGGGGAGVAAAGSTPALGKRHPHPRRTPSRVNTRAGGHCSSNTRRAFRALTAAPSDSPSRVPGQPGVPGSVAQAQGLGPHRCLQSHLPSPPPGWGGAPGDPGAPFLAAGPAEERTPSECPP
nr:cuticle collagen 2-like [Odocoileus virginianus texanus]